MPSKSKWMYVLLFFHITGVTGPSKTHLDLQLLQAFQLAHLHRLISIWRCLNFQGFTTVSGQIAMGNLIFQAMGGLGFRSRQRFTSLFLESPVRARLHSAKMSTSKIFRSKRHPPKSLERSSFSWSGTEMYRICRKSDKFRVFLHVISVLIGMNSFEATKLKTLNLHGKKPWTATAEEIIWAKGCAASVLLFVNNLTGHCNQVCNYAASSGTKLKPLWQSRIPKRTTKEPRGMLSQSTLANNKWE